MGFYTFYKTCAKNAQLKIKPSNELFLPLWYDCITDSIKVV